MLQEMTSRCGVSCSLSGIEAGSIAGPGPAFLEEEVSGVAGSLAELRAGDLFVALPFADGDAHCHVEEALAAGASLALVSEDWEGLASLDPSLQARCATTPDVLSSFRCLAAAFRRELPCPVIAVFGCNGKTTTKEMLAALLSAPGRRVVKTPGTDNGFVGLPRTLCSREIRSAAPPEVVVLEIGIDATGAMESHARMTAPDVAVLTALGPEHLDGLGDTETAIAEELSLFREVPAATRVVPWGDPEVQRRRLDTKAIVRVQDIAVVEEGSLTEERLSWPPSSRTLVFRTSSRGEGSGVAASWFTGGEQGSPAWEGHFDVPLPGAHNAGNFALALAAALALGRSPETIARGWETFEAPPWRSRVTPLARGALLYDDSFNASPLAVRAALAALAEPSWADRPKVIVLGDMLELGAESARWHLELASSLCQLDTATLHLFGPRMAALGRALEVSGAGGAAAPHDGSTARGAAARGAAARGAAARGAAVGRTVEDASRDPVDLVWDLDLPAGAVVLVKGSRGMRMERVVRYLQLLWGLGPAAAAQALERVKSVLVTGSCGATETAKLVAETLRSQGIGVGRLDGSGVFLNETPILAPAGTGARTALLQRCVAADIPFAVVEVAHADILAAASLGPVAVAVLSGFSEADLPPGGDVERHLAEKAQLFLRARGLRAVVLPADDPGADLLAEVLPAGVRILRFGTVESGRPLDLRATSVTVAGGRTRVALAGPHGLPTSIEVAGEGLEFARAAMAACLVALVLGGSPQSAAGRLC